MKKIFTLALFIFSFSFFPFLNAQTGTWTAVTNLPPHPNNGVCLLMTDGTVICKNNSGGGNGTGWDRLTPDIHGSYINGTWDTIASMFEDRLFFSSQILPSGKVYVAGGEYGAGTNAGEVYDPVTNTWTMCGPIPGGWKIYDGNSEILYDGTVLEGPQIGSVWSYNILIWSPVTYNYTTEGNSIYNHDEAEWLKLPDSSVLFVGIASQYANRYVPQMGRWVYDDTTPGDLYDAFGEEAGCALMLPNGKAIFFGATPYNCIYTPSGDTDHGVWTSADSFPKIQGTYVGQPDASGAMMVNGHILLACSPIGTGSNEFNSPAYFVEYDYVSNTFTQVKAAIPGQGGDSISYIACYQTQMLDLPDGNVLVSISQTDTVGNQYYIYTPGSGPIPQGKPTINNIIPDTCFFYKITGKLFNGISEGAAYGDDWQMSTNWPLVRLTNGSGDVYYAKTSNWNRIGAVQTDSLEDTAYFALPSMPGGTYSVQVVVNGFASNPVLLTTFGVSVSSQNITCNGANTGSATATASNGATPYTYLWMPGGATTASVSGLSAGVYTIRVTGNGGGCSATASVTITQPAALSVSAIAANSCAPNSGRASATASGGTSPYTYHWSGSGGTNATATGLSAGTYTITVSDMCGGTATASATVNTYAPLILSIDSVNNIYCNGDTTGSASAFVSGGAPQYTYSWSGGGTNESIYGLSAGTYTVTATDSCGNSITASVNITQPSPLLVSTGFLPTGTGVCDGSAWVNVSGGTSPYTYAWSNSKTTDSIFNLCSIIYCCTVTDAYGCTSFACDTIVTSSAGINNIEPGNGEISVYPNPNNGNFTIQSSVVSHPLSVEIYNVLGEKVYSNPFTIHNSQFTINLSSQPNGIYFYRVMEENGNLAGEGKLIIEK